MPPEQVRLLSAEYGWDPPCPKNSIGKVFEMSLIFFVSLLLLLIVGALLVNEK